jgi:hypothetical protein
VIAPSIVLGVARVAAFAAAAFGAVAAAFGVAAAFSAEAIFWHSSSHTLQCCSSVWHHNHFLFPGHLHLFPHRSDTGIGFPLLGSLRTGLGARLWVGTIGHTSLLKNLVQPASVRQGLDAGIVLYATITTHYIFRSKFHPHQKIIVAFSLKLGEGKLGQGKVTFDIGVSPSAIYAKPKLAENGNIPQGKYSSTASQLPIRPVAWTKAMSPKSSFAHSNEGSVKKSRGAILE